MNEKEKIQPQKEVFAILEKAGAVIVKAPSIAFEIRKYGESFYVFKSMLLMVNFSGVEIVGNDIFLYVWQKIDAEYKKMYVGTVEVAMLKNVEIGFVVKK